MAIPAMAGAVLFGQDTHLSYVTETRIPTIDGGTYALCQRVEQKNLLFVGYWARSTGYVISPSNCTGVDYSELIDGSFESAIAAGAIEGAFTENPGLSGGQIFNGFLIWFFLVPIIFYVIMNQVLLGALKTRSPRAAATPAADQTAAPATDGPDAFLDVVFNAARADGGIAPHKVKTICEVARKLAGRGYSERRVKRFVAERLREAEAGRDSPLLINADRPDRSLLMQAALMTIVADGQMTMPEHRFLNGLANILEITRQEFDEIFRRTLGAA